MKIVPTSIEEQINRVDRQRSLYIGISTGLLAVWSLYRVFWALYLSMTFGSFIGGALIFQIVLWGVIGVAAGVASAGFLIRYNKGS
jgi:hypothetical protein